MNYWKSSHLISQINFIHVEPTTESHCMSDLSDPGFRAFDDVANRFGGMAWHVDDRSKVYEVDESTADQLLPSSENSTLQVLYGHMNSIIYKSQLILTIDREECGNGLGKVRTTAQLKLTKILIIFFPEIELITGDSTREEFKQPRVYRKRTWVPGEFNLLIDLLFLDHYFHRRLLSRNKCAGRANTTAKDYRQRRNLRNWVSELCRNSENRTIIMIQLTEWLRIPFRVPIWCARIRIRRLPLARYEFTRYFSLHVLFPVFLKILQIACTPLSSEMKKFSSDYVRFISGFIPDLLKRIADWSILENKHWCRCWCCYVPACFRNG